MFDLLKDALIVIKKLDFPVTLSQIIRLRNEVANSVKVFLDASKSSSDHGSFLFMGNLHLVNNSFKEVHCCGLDEVR